MNLIKKELLLLSIFFTKMRQKSNKSIWENDMREMRESMEEMTTRVLNTLRDYDTKLLGVKKTKGGVFCELSEFLGTLVNCGDQSPMMVPSNHLDEYLPTQVLTKIVTIFSINEDQNILVNRK